MDLEKISNRTKENQREIIESLSKGRDALLMGVAGSSKSYIIRQFTKRLDDLKESPRLLLSPSGIGAINIGGRTIDSCIIKSDNIRMTTKIAIMKRTAKISRRSKILTIVVDEFFMICKCKVVSMFKYIENMIHFCLERNISFPPGVRWILSGDPMQLPPIPCGQECQGEYFGSEEWDRMCKRFLTIYMEDNIRAVDSYSKSFLTRMRRNEVTQLDKYVISSITCNNSEGDQKSMNLVATRSEASNINNAALKKIEGDCYLFYPSFNCIGYNLGRDYSKSVIDDYIEEIAMECDHKNYMRDGTTSLDVALREIKKLTTSDVPLVIKDGSFVMITTNYNIGKGLANGTIGYLRILDRNEEPYKSREDRKTINHVHIQIKDKLYKILPKKILKGFGLKAKNFTNTEKSLNCYKFLGLQLCYAATVHKSQGLTIANLRGVDLNIRCPGQYYTMCSRMISLKNFQMKVSRQIPTQSKRKLAMVEKFRSGCDILLSNGRITNKPRMYNLDKYGIYETSVDWGEELDNISEINIDDKKMIRKLVASHEKREFLNYLSIEDRYNFESLQRPFKFHCEKMFNICLMELNKLLIRRDIYNNGDNSINGSKSDEEDSKNLQKSSRSQRRPFVSKNIFWESRIKREKQMRESRKNKPKYNISSVMPDIRVSIKGRGTNFN